MHDPLNLQRWLPQEGYCQHGIGLGRTMAPAWQAWFATGEDATMETSDTPFLRPTEGCQWNVPELLGVAAHLAPDQDDPWRYARNCFNFVSNEILFLPSLPAPESIAETLRRGCGICVDKAHVLVGLLRAGGVPARYRVLSPREQGDPGSQATRMRGLLHQDGRPHPQVEIQLGDFWIACDPTFGDAECAGLGAPLPRLGYDPFLMFESSGRVLDRPESLPPEGKRQQARVRICPYFCRDERCINRFINNARQRGKVVLATNGCAAYMAARRNRYVPLAGAQLDDELTAGH